MYFRIEILHKENGWVGIGSCLGLFLRDLPCPCKGIKKNSSFFFTEKGWSHFGRALVAVMLEDMLEAESPILDFRIITHATFNKDKIVYKDKWQVAIG